MKRQIVIGDADSIIAQANQADLQHGKAVKIAKKLITRKTQLFYPATAVAEAVTFIQRVLDDKSAAFEIAEEFSRSPCQVIEIGSETLHLAVSKYFSAKSSKKNTLFDCLVAATAELQKAEAMFSFDKFYQKQGFKLADEL